MSRESKIGLLVASLNLSVHPLSVCREKQFQHSRPVPEKTVSVNTKVATSVAITSCCLCVLASYPCRNEPVYTCVETTQQVVSEWCTLYGQLQNVATLMDRPGAILPVVHTMLPDRVLSISLLLLWVVVVGSGRVWVGGCGACARRVRSDISDCVRSSPSTLAYCRQS